MCFWFWMRFRYNMKIQLFREDLRQYNAYNLKMIISNYSVRKYTSNVEITTF